MGSIAMDKAGDIAMGYSATSSSIHPAVRYTGRVPGDTLGTMELEAPIYDGDRLADGHAQPLGRLQRDVDRPGRPVHVLVHAPST